MMCVFIGRTKWNKTRTKKLHVFVSPVDPGPESEPKTWGGGNQGPCETLPSLDTLGVSALISPTLRLERSNRGRVSSRKSLSVTILQRNSFLKNVAFHFANNETIFSFQKQFVFILLTSASNHAGKKLPAASDLMKRVAFFSA